jgi:hypothetical protein
MVAPALGTVWLADGAQKTIQWNRLGLNTIQNVKVEYDPDGNFSGGLPTVTIAASASPLANDGCTPPGGGGCYFWTPTAANLSAGRVAKIRVSATDANATHLFSDSGAFTVATLATVASAGGEVWRQGDEHTLSWTASTGFGTVALAYAADGNFGGGSVFSIASGVPAQSATQGPGATGTCTVPVGGGCYVWAIPDDGSVPAASVVNAAKIQVTGTVSGAPDTHAMQTPGFTLIRLSLAQPAGGETWVVGTPGHDITWNAAGALTDVTVKYTPDGTAFSKMLGTVPATDGSLAWDIPADATYISSAPNAGRIELSAVVGATTLTDVSTGFTVSKPIFTITSPAGGTVVGISPPTFPITWTTTGAPVSNSLAVEYSSNGGGSWTPACPGIQVNDGTCDWIVPGAAASDTVQIRVRDTMAPNGEGLSGVFAVAGAFTILSPNIAGMKWAAGKAHAIQWTNTGAMRNVRIEYSKTGVGGPFTALGTVATASPYTSGTFSWTPAAADASVQAVIRLVDVDNTISQPKDSPDFAVTTVDVQAPACPAGRCLVGAAHNLTWTQTGLTEVKLYYSTGGT